MSKVTPALTHPSFKSNGSKYFHNPNIFDMITHAHTLTLSCSGILKLAKYPMQHKISKQTQSYQLTVDVNVLFTLQEPRAGRSFLEDQEEGLCPST